MSKVKPYRTYTHDEIHRLLANKFISKEYREGKYTEDTGQQALFCPYYVCLEYPLGADWGIIVNPESPKFGEICFEHDHCFCPNHEPGAGHQTGKDWLRR